MLPSLSHREPSSRSPSKPPDTTPSSAPTPGAPSTPLPAPSAANLLHHRRSPPLGLHRHGTPCSGEPSPLFSRQSGPPPCRLALRALHHRPPAGRILPASHRCRRGRKPPLALPQAKRLRWAGPLRSGWAEHYRGSPNEHYFLLFFLWINSIHSKSNSNFWIK
jgi:hypothetical protein